MLGIIQSAALVGVDAHPVQVEVNTGEAGELKFILVGLPDATVINIVYNHNLSQTFNNSCHVHFAEGC